MEKRNTSVELLRLLSMVMVVVHHIVGQGIGFQFYSGGVIVDYVGNWGPIMFVESFCIVGVNIFLLISGYFGIKLRVSRIIKFLAVVFGFVLLHSVCEGFYNDAVALKHMLRTALFFFSGNTAWFVRAYFVLMLSAFIINPALEKMNKRQVLTALIFLLFVNVYLGFFRHWDINENGYTVSHMIMMYVLGYAVKVYGIPSLLKRTTFFSSYILISVLLGLIMLLSLWERNNETGNWLLSYNNPLVMLSSVSLFCCFVKGEFHNRKLNYVLSGVFGIYLLHQYRPFWMQVMIPTIRKHFIHDSASYFILYSIGLVFAFAIVGIIINLLLVRIVNVILENRAVSRLVKNIDVKLEL